MRAVRAVVLAVVACESTSPLPAPEVATPSPAPPSCAPIGRVPDRVLGARSATLGSAFADVVFDAKLRDVPSAFAAWRGIELFTDQPPPVGIDGVTVVPEWRGDPPRLFALELAIPGSGLADLLIARWGAPERLKTGDLVWADPAGHRRARVTTRGCSGVVIVEPVMTVDELLALDLEKLVGKTVGAVAAETNDAREPCDCPVSDGYGPVIRIPALPFHRGPLCVSTARGDLPAKLMSARIAALGVDTCALPEHPAWLDEVPDAAYDELVKALTRRFGTPRRCANPDGDVRPPLQFRHRTLRITIGSTGIAMSTRADACG